MSHFINDSCINCAACESVCPVPCITEGEGHRVIDESSCIDCATCASVCPVDAIAVH